MVWDEAVPRYKAHVAEAGTTAALGEGPSWSPRDRLLYWVDIEGHAVRAHDPRSGRAAHVMPTGAVGRPSFVVRRASAAPTLLVGAERSLVEIDVAAPAPRVLTSPVVSEHPLRFNDGKCDRAGHLIAGTMSDVRPRAVGTARVYSVAADAASPGGVTTRELDAVGPVTVSNGIAWSADDRWMYYIDTPTGLLRKFPYDVASGNVTGPATVLVEKPQDAPGGFDGMCRDAEGGLWVALFRGSLLSRWDSESGKLLGVVELPTTGVTSCCWGGDDLGDLYITTAKHADEGNELAGSLFCVRIPGLTGVPSFEFS